MNKNMELGIVFFESVMKKLIPENEERALGYVNYNSNYGGSRVTFLANIIYRNEQGKLMLANDYFKAKEISEFSKKDGVSAGYMIDNWGPKDDVYYKEKEAPEGLEKALKELDLSTSGYSKKDWEEKIEAISEKISETEGDITGLAKELGFNLASYFGLCHKGEPLDSKEEFSYNLVLKGEEDSIRPLYPLNGGELIDGVSIEGKEGGNPEIYFFTSDKERVEIEEMSPEGLIEITDLLIEQSFYGATQI